MAGGKEIVQVSREFATHLASGQARDVQRLEFLGYVRAGRIRVVNADRQNEQRAFRNVARTVDRIAPFAAAITFEPALRYIVPEWQESAPRPTLMPLSSSAFRHWDISQSTKRPFWQVPSG